MKSNRSLAVVAVVLFLLSVWAYRSSTVRADRFETGQRFLPNLNPDEVAEIVVTKGEETVTLKRGDDKFTVVEAENYPAKNESVNRLLRDLIELELDREAGRGEDLFEEFALVAGGEETTEVLLSNAAGKAMVHLLVGANFEGGAGSFVRRADDQDGAVFVTAKRVNVNATQGNYLNKEIVDVKRDDIARISGPDFVIASTEDGLKLEGVRRGQEEKPSEMNRVKGVLTYLRFDEVYLADDEEVSGLDFEPKVEVELANGSIYRMALAERGEDAFLRISGTHTVQRVMVGREETDEELEEKAEMLAAADEMGKFNAFHASWVYKVATPTADKVKLTKKDLVQAKGANAS